MSTASTLDENQSIKRSIPYSDPGSSGDKAETAKLGRGGGWELLIRSFASLFLELAIIRWLSTEIRIFAYFKNLPLMAAFLGFGLGFLMQGKTTTWFPWFPRLICYLCIIISGAGGLGITHVVFADPRQYLLFGVGFGDHTQFSVPSVLQMLKAITVMGSIFFLVMAVFATLCTKLGELFNRQRPLVAYSINIAGSLLGIVGFTCVSYLCWPPFAWLIVAFVPLLYFFSSHLKLATLYFGAPIAFAVFTYFAYPSFWSPYYRISLHPVSAKPFEIQLAVNHDGFQVIENLSPGHMATLPEAVQRVYYGHYDLPYHLSKTKIRSVLVLGGGSGNDAAAALRNGADEVDVVEIDPVIVELGRKLHPEQPYASRRVHLHVDDARSFLQKTHRLYDLVVFATLDSHTVFSSLSSLRLDNFVFTEESLHNALSHLQPEGGIAINFFNAKPWLSQRHLMTLTKTMHAEPLAYESSSSQSILLLGGECFDASREMGMTEYRPVHPPFAQESVEPITDNWPFLFLEHRGFPFHYFLPLGVIGLVSLITMSRSPLRLKEIDGHMFLMGAAFLLIETKSVTMLALLFGSTWMVNSVVIGSILVVILLSNGLVAGGRVPGFGILYPLLSLTLVLSYGVSLGFLNQYQWITRALLGGVITALPILFASLIFARAFSAVEIPSQALACNLLGGLLGGMLEYLDMWLGLRALNLLALGLYLLSWLFLVIRKNSKGILPLQQSR